MKKNPDFSLLPGDLVILVLSFLPVKSMLRFKCVCKSLYALFASSSFISKHIINSDHHRLIIGYHMLPNGASDFKILDYNTLQVIADDFRFRYLNRRFLLHTDTCFDSDQRLLGSYNGLVCVASESLEEFAFWNPATRQIKIVNRSNEINDQLEGTHHAFGYDFKTNDYKVMRITPLTKKTPYKYDQIEVYSFFSGSWKNSDAVIPDGVCLDDACERPTICVKGIYSTVAYTTDAKDAKERESRNYFMFTIDMSNETIILTPLPEKGVSYEASAGNYKVLTELKNTVAFIKCQVGPSEAEKSYGIFILNEYGPNAIWTKLYTFTVGRYLGRPIGFWKNDELFIDNCSGISPGDLVLCDRRTHVRKNLDICGIYMQILEYKESLVWINDHRFGI